MEPVTLAEAKRILMLEALSEAIKSLGNVPAGELYAHVMHAINHEEFESSISMLVRLKFVSRSNNMLTWCGPA